MGVSGPSRDLANRSVHFQRRDIQGLRAVAVGVVVLEHIRGWPSGGFAGVDIFFVISGFLITSMLLRQYETTGTISFRRFYAGRVKRILPAATITVLVTIAASFAAFSADRARSIAWDGFWASVFVANWNSAVKGTDYFDRDAAVSPLQHFWSLSVEEQFYFVWPWLLLAALVLMSRRSPLTPRRIRLTAGTLIGLLSVLSFWWALVEVQSAPTVAYFSTLTRSWELGLGALVACLAPLFVAMPTLMRTWLLYAGLFGIVASVILIDSESLWPAPWALAPTVSTALVIISGIGDEAPYDPVLRNRLSVYVGDISYSLYLWHFPVLVILGPLLPFTGGWSHLLLIGVSFGAAIAAYHLIEDPIRRSPLWVTDGRGSWRTWAAARVRPAVIGTVVGSATLAMVVVMLVMVPRTGAMDGTTIEQPETSTALEGAKAELAVDLYNALTAEDWPRDIDAQLARSGYGDQRVWDCASPVGYSFSGCEYGHGEQVAIVVGDSIANAYLPSLLEILDPDDWRIRQLTLNGCEFNQIVLASERSQPYCEERLDTALDEIARIKPDVVFVSNQWYVHKELGAEKNLGFESWWDGASSALDSIGDIPTVYIAPPPYQVSIDSCYTSIAKPSDCVSKPSTAWERADATLRVYDTNADNFVYVSSYDWFCYEDLCPAFAREEITRSDKLHPGQYYLEKIRDVLAEDIGDALGG